MTEPMDAEQNVDFGTQIEQDPFVVPQDVVVDDEEEAARKNKKNKKRTLVFDEKRGGVVTVHKRKPGRSKAWEVDELDE